MNLDLCRHIKSNGTRCKSPALTERPFCLSLVINALATGQLEIKRATALLYGLQLASHNAERTRSEPFAHSIVLSTDSLPDGLEVAIPGGTLNVTSPS
jgi:hypothetical protein